MVDKSEPGERMRGYPVTRVDGPGGRWAYTLYDGAGGHPFVHALDTVEQTAVCIDLDGLTGRKDLQMLRLALDPGQARLSVVKGTDPVALIDTRTFAVRMAGATAAGAGLVVGVSMVGRRARDAAHGRDGGATCSAAAARASPSS